MCNVMFGFIFFGDVISIRIVDNVMDSFNNNLCDLMEFFLLLLFICVDVSFFFFF